MPTRNLLKYILKAYYPFGGFLEIGCLSSDSFCGLMGGDFSTFTSLGEPASIMYTALFKNLCKRSRKEDKENEERRGKLTRFGGRGKPPGACQSRGTTGVQPLGLLFGLVHEELLLLHLLLQLIVVWLLNVRKQKGVGIL